MISAIVREEAGKDNEGRARPVGRQGARPELTRTRPRRLTYAGDAHLVGPSGDLTATKIELYLHAVWRRGRAR